MIIQDALNLNKPIRRSSGSVTFDARTQAVFTLSLQELLAGDWEVVEEPISITESKLEDVMTRAGIGSEAIATVCKALGL